MLVSFYSALLSSQADRRRGPICQQLSATAVRVSSSKLIGNNGCLRMKSKVGRGVRLGAVSSTVILMAICVSGQQPARPALPAAPQELVRQMVSNELGTGRQQHFMYRLTKLKPESSEVRQMLETDSLLLSRVLLVDGKPLKRDEARKEDQRLQRLLQDHDELARKRDDQIEEEKRIRKMIAALPDAFLYEYTGRAVRPFGEVVTLKFRPNPDFDPPSRETQVYRGMEGAMEISVADRRLALIEATLTKEVNFGWGILGHLDKGGHFEVQQAPEMQGQWMMTRMKLDFTGKVLVFKSLKIRQEQSTSNYEPVQNLSVAQGVELLKKMDTELARGSGAQR